MASKHDGSIQVLDMFGIRLEVGDHVVVSLTGNKLGIGRVVALESSPKPNVVVALAEPDGDYVFGSVRKLKGSLSSFSHQDSIGYLPEDAFDSFTYGEKVKDVINEQATIWHEAHVPEPVVPVTSGVIDMNHERLALGDWVVTPNNGPFMVYGRVVGLVHGPRGGVEVLTAERPENDPDKPYEGRLRTVNSPVRLIKVPPLYPPVHGEKIKVIADTLADLVQGGWKSTATVTRETTYGNG